MAFDPQARLVATAATSPADLERQFGEVGLVNGPRTGLGRRTTIASEAYLARRLIFNLVEAGALEFPVSVIHGDRPDFTILDGRGEMLLEVTEACPSKDGKRFAKQAEGTHPIGNYSEAGLERARADLLGQMQKAINEKCSKAYAARDLSLLIYPNSDASQWVSFFDPRPGEIFARLDIKCLKALYIFWNQKFVRVIGKH
ncbi:MULTISPECIES: hypothetical protein [unclassified Caulobacter]|uniref:hypothetical protein n=1 Tax=unclassified Caulobacter TaxID=2648921 RepID=UPI000FDA21A4|nr:MULTISPECIES: hypothetical protein [unclassified Caulobacter]